jgi:hypothetical protein
MILIKDLVPDTQVPIEQAAKMLEDDPLSLLMLLLNSNHKILFGFNGTTTFSTLNVQDKRSILNDIVHFGTGRLYGVSKCFSKEVGNCKSCLFSNLKTKKCSTYSREVKMSDVTVRAGDVAALFYSDDEQAGESTKGSNTKRERNLLKIIGALLSIRYSGPKYEINGKVNIKAVAQQFNIDLANKTDFDDNGIKEDSLRKHVIKDAFEAIEENRRQYKN